MPESNQHLQLVKILIEEISKNVPPDCVGLIQFDSPDSTNHPPETIEGYRPDAYYQFENLLVIGEAKTSDDVDRRHSRDQYEAYLKECASFYGQAFFVITVPLLEKATANNILYNLRKTIPGDYKIIVKGWIGGSV